MADNSSSPPHRSAASAILGNRCPHCREGRIFAFSFLNPARFFKMNHNCPQCGQDFIIEPGFYYGAMYFTYGLNVALIVGTMLFFSFVIDSDNTWLMVGAAAVGIILMTPLNFRASRILMLYIFSGVKYNPAASRNLGIGKSVAGVRNLQNDGSQGQGLN